MLTEGVVAPDFKLLGDDGKEHSLAQFKGKNLILYFYPKDSTSACTTEAVEFTAMVDKFKELDAVIVGVSPDSVDSHKKFKINHALKILLLSDPEKEVAKMYEAYGEKKMYGKVVMGIMRSTYLISPEGIITKVWDNVKAGGHANAVYSYCELSR